MAVTDTPTVSPQPLTPLRFLERSAAVHPDKVGIVDGDRRITYAEMAAEATRLARALHASGIEAGDRVAYLCPNVTEMLVAHFAVPLAGAVLVPLNTRLAGPEISGLLEHSGARLLVAHASLRDRVPEDVAEVEEVVTVGDGPGVTYADLLARGSDEPLPWEVEDELSTISINYTSGTTGKPKGVMYTHRGAYLNALGELLHSEHSADTVYLWTLPMFHCDGWCTTWAITGIAGTNVCLPEVRGEEVWRLLREEGVTHLNGAPTVLTTIATTEGAALLGRTLTVTTAGAPPAPRTIMDLEALGARIVHVYGLTETYGPYSVCEWQPGWGDLDGEERATLLARQGVGMLQADRLRVVDEDMTDVPADGATMGEIVMRGNNVMKGYFRDEEATAEAFRGGWYHSGDLGVMHPDGYVQLLDRAKDVVVSGGENVSTIEVEQALVSHPGVLEAAVVGVPDEKWGERPKAFVVLASDPGDLDGDALIAHVRERIAGYKAPREVELVEELPKTSTGKVQKYELREQEWTAAGDGGGAARIRG